MSAQKLTAFERAVLAGLADKAGLAAALLEAWADLPADSVQSARSLVDAAQLGVTEEGATRDLLERSVGFGLVEATPAGFKPRNGVHTRFQRLAFALHAVEHYRSSVHRDATLAQVVLTKPPQPSVLEQKLSALGWRTTELEPTEHAFHGMVRAAQRRVVVMTPFFDSTGAAWLNAPAMRVGRLDKKGPTRAWLRGDGLRNWWWNSRRKNSDRQRCRGLPQRLAPFAVTGATSTT
jgi:hypothetical protein